MKWWLKTVVLITLLFSGIITGITIYIFSYILDYFSSNWTAYRYVRLSDMLNFADDYVELNFYLNKGIYSLFWRIIMEEEEADCGFVFFFFFFFSFFSFFFYNRLLVTHAHSWKVRKQVVILGKFLSKALVSNL